MCSLLLLIILYLYVGISICDIYFLLQILWEVTAGQIGKAPPVGTAIPTAAGASNVVVSDEEEDEEELERMQSRLEALRS